MKPIIPGKRFAGLAVLLASTFFLWGCPPSNLSYAPQLPLLVRSSIAPISPTVTGTVSSYSVSPALPLGLSIDPHTGVISGTPTSVTPSAVYRVTATNSSGNTSFPLTLQVDSGPTVHLSANASSTSSSTLSFQWKTSDGVVLNTNGAQADWLLPPGPGLHFAYALVTDGNG
ncbi:MAG TPA: Ig domain-containing protein, partial [Candidatus Sulfotelmatobacter sp.]|nr:Ig domain-containing protein [Candidatus Sulfotelmatobacter sp.]